MKRLWGIRHIRYWWLRRALTHWSDGVEGPFWHIAGTEWDYLEAVWEGKR